MNHGDVYLALFWTPYEITEARFMQKGDLEFYCIASQTGTSIADPSIRLARLSRYCGLWSSCSQCHLPNVVNWLAKVRLYWRSHSLACKALLGSFRSVHIIRLPLRLKLVQGQAMPLSRVPVILISRGCGPRTLCIFLSAKTILGKALSSSESMTRPHSRTTPNAPHRNSTDETDRTFMGIIGRLVVCPAASTVL